MRSISEVVNHFKENWISELGADKIEQACLECSMSWINSMLNPVTTIQIFLLQVLFGNTACSHMPHLTGMCFTAAGYCKARLRIKLKVFELLLKRCVDQLQRSTLDCGKWLGHRVFIVDGSSFSMPVFRCPIRRRCKAALVSRVARNQVVDFRQRTGWQCCTFKLG